MKKRFYLFLILAVVALIGTACSNGDDDQSSEKGKKKISIFIPGYEDEQFKPLYDASINDFRKDNKDVDVKIVPAGWDEANSKIVSLIQAGEAPDVMITGSRSLRQFAELNAIEKLDSFITDDFKEKRVKNVLDTAKINGDQYGIPLAFTSRAFFYRSDLIANPPKTWDELYETAKKIKKAHPDMYAFAIPTDMVAGTDELLNFIYQSGGTITDKKGNIQLANKNNIEALKYLKKFVDEKLVPNPVGLKRGDQSAMFQNGDLAMFISGPWEKATMKESKETPYKVTQLPKGKQMAVTLVTDSYSISSQSKNKDLAWKLIEYMGQYKYQNAYDKAIGFFPILKEEEKEDRYKSDFMKPFAEMIQYGQSEPHVPAWDPFNEAFITAVQKTLTGKASAEDSLKAADKELQTK